MNTSLNSRLQASVSNFKPIFLDEMGSVRLMSRMDTKYVFNLERLPGILQEVSDFYRMLEIKGKKEQVYETMYFDSPAYSMYTSHHNGKLNRHKIRVRKYVSTEEKYLEVKFKNNKQRTIKKRTRDEERNISLSENQYRFIEETTTFGRTELKPSLKNSFTRLTLVNNNLNERITVDYDLSFEDPVSGNADSKENICIVEVKKDRNAEKSDFMKVLDKERIRSAGFSKYCMGLSYTGTEVKKNRFKKKMRKIEKTSQSNFT
jgi:hypothetical protein